MPKNDVFYDLYLYVIPKSDKLVKIPHLSKTEADNYARCWFDMNELHDYMLVTEGSKPWSEPAPSIEIQSPEWILSEYRKINEV